VSLFVCRCADFPYYRREIVGFESPSLRHILQGNSDGDSQRDSQTSVPLSPDLSQVVTAWEKLPAPLKAAILAIIKTAE
jgi:hypothetical protein